MKKCKPLIRAAIVAALALAAPQSHAQDNYPNKPIRMLVPLAAGSFTDILARMIGQKMYESWGQQVVVDNRPSGGGVAASQVVASSNPDGHTLLMVSAQHAISATVYSKLPYDTVKDFAGISQVASGAHVVAAGKDLGVKSMKELIALAKSKPGQINWGTSGIGSGAHINGEMLKIDAGIDVNYIAYKGPLEAMNDVIAGRIGYTILFVGVAAPFIRDGRVIGLGVSTAARSPLLPNVPAIGEALPGHTFDNWFALLAPARRRRGRSSIASIEKSCGS